MKSETILLFDFAQTDNHTVFVVGFERLNGVALKRA